MVVDIGDIEESLFHVGFRHALDRVAELGGHQLGGVVVDHVVDLQHQALTHQELDHFHATRRHPLGQFAHGDDVGDHHFARNAGLLLLAAAAALFLFAFAGPAHRGQGAHPLDGVLAVAGHRLDGQTPLAALGLALGARDGVLQRGRALGALAALFVVRLRTPIDFARARGLAGRALDFRRRRGWRAAAAGTAGTGAARTRATVARGTRGQGRIADGLAAGTARAGAAVAARAIAVTRRAIAEGAVATGPVALSRRPVGIRPVTARTVAITALSRRTGTEGGGAAGVAVVAAEAAIGARFRTRAPVFARIGVAGRAVVARAIAETAGARTPIVTAEVLARTVLARRPLLGLRARLGRRTGGGGFGHGLGLGLRSGFGGGSGRSRLRLGGGLRGARGFLFAAAGGFLLGPTGLLLAALLRLAFLIGASGLQHPLAGAQFFRREVEVRSARRRRRRRWRGGTRCGRGLGLRLGRLVSRTRGPG